MPHVVAWAQSKDSFVGKEWTTLVRSRQRYVAMQIELAASTHLLREVLVVMAAKNLWLKLSPFAP